ncbi:MAG: SsrA-binding protein SmpB [Bacteroidetes bacterium]|nr:SsrA-binding protein SmpB [Bacteroidota bacterium]
MADKRIEITNRKAGFQFHVEQKYTAGIMLTGSEVKSIRAGSINMGDAYCFIEAGELFIRHLHISEYNRAGYSSHEVMRDRKLLLGKQELQRVELKVKSKGYTIFPIRLFENERGIFKLEIGLGQGKKLHDKRDDLKEKDVKREMERYK